MDIHYFQPETVFSLPESFTDPFRYFPHPLVIQAAGEVMAGIDSDPELRSVFLEGKMLGVLIVENGYLAAFSGSVGGRSHIEGFVPPIFDLLDPSGHFKAREAEITAINNKIHSLENSSELASLGHELAEAEKDRDKEIGFLKASMAISKRRRDEIRCELSDSSDYAMLVRESQFEKAELKRLKLGWEEKIAQIKDNIGSIITDIEILKKRRSQMSDELQDWIFRQYIVHNSLGEESSIKEIFSAKGLVPPGGTGDCAAPKLLEYAFRNGLKPLAMGEFWYGKSPDTAVRTHGHFYPSCTSKCGPLLGWMMRGMEITSDTGYGGCNCDVSDHRTCVRDLHGLEIIYEDEVLVAVDKPSGMPSVPGLDGRVSAFELLKMDFEELHTVHRLDMDTSGILLFAKTAAAAVCLQKQFEDHTIRKTYMARLSPEDNPSSACSGSEDCQEVAAGNVLGMNKCLDLTERMELPAGKKGRIELPLSPDYDERPRQKVDFAQGKAAVTDYEVVSVNEDGTTDIIFHPLTGRTHQLRVHSAHTLGLARPILGDPLYGGGPTAASLHQHITPTHITNPGTPAPQLHLRATSITILHPLTTLEVCITTPESVHKSPK